MRVLLSDRDRHRASDCVAVVGGAVGLLMILMKVLPVVPGHFNRYEWLALGIWIALGATVSASSQRVAPAS